MIKIFYEDKSMGFIEDHTANIQQLSIFMKRKQVLGDQPPIPVGPG
jgi:hypothetical protein